METKEILERIAAALEKQADAMERLADAMEEQVENTDIQNDLQREMDKSLAQLAYCR